MVKYSVGTDNRRSRAQEEWLNEAFAAVSDPTRRAIVAELGRKQGNVKSVGQLAEPFNISLPAVMKHIQILEESGLVSRRKIGRVVYCHLNYQKLHAAGKWLEPYDKFWNAQLDNLDRYSPSSKNDAF